MGVLVIRPAARFVGGMASIAVFAILVTMVLLSLWAVELVPGH